MKILECPQCKQIDNWVIEGYTIYCNTQMPKDSIVSRCYYHPKKYQQFAIKKTLGEKIPRIINYISESNLAKEILKENNDKEGIVWAKGILKQRNKVNEYHKKNKLKWANHVEKRRQNLKEYEQSLLSI